MSGARIPVVFEGIDNFNRPVFKEKSTGRRFGSTSMLFSYDAKPQYVRRCVCCGEATMLTYFGTKFNCEPTGGEHAVRIIG